MDSLFKKKRKVCEMLIFNKVGTKQTHKKKLKIRRHNVSSTYPLSSSGV